ncbi:transglycosylase family protein [Streptomyces sp. NPDC014983]|uniref:transglycosylase family protein n=1 Tax=Streptomyces sp. NPDC014983 TaxID=3364933 RepID=UPI0036F4FA39
MISGNGRHRRPRQAPALLVAAGVTGSAIAIPLLGAASAHAADGTTWDKVAECESGGSWSADTGNGYYGGLQISQEDWVQYGGTRYASSADQASRSQQIAVAERILKDKGTVPWATCALLSGLTSNSGSVDVDPGVGDGGGQGGSTTDPSGLPDPSSPAGAQSGDQNGSGNGSGSGGASSADPSGSSASPGQGSGKQTGKHATPHPGKPTGTPGTGAPSPDPSDPSGPSGPSGPSDSSDPSVPATPSAPAGTPTAPAPSTGTPDNARQNVGSWDLVDTGALSGGRHRGGNADESTTNGQNDSSSGRHASREPGTYTVRDGDSLSSIADSLDVDGGWHALYSANKKVVGADPNLITAGQTLKVGDETGATQG